MLSTQLANSGSKLYTERTFCSHKAVRKLVKK